KLLVGGEADRIGHWIREIVDQLERRAAKGKATFTRRCASVIIPIGQVDRRLELFRDSEFQLVPEIDLAKTAIAGLVSFPRQPVLDFHIARRRSGDFVNVGEATRARERRERQQEK